MPAGKLTVADLKSEMMNRLDGVSKAQVNQVMKAMVEEVHDCLSLGYSIGIPGMGTWEPQLKAGKKKGQVVRNPFAGTEETLKKDQPDKFAIRVKKPAGLANRIFPAMTTKAGKELAAKLK